MADNFNISYSFNIDTGADSQPGASPAPGADAEPLYALMNVKPLNLGNNRALLIHEHSGAQLLVAMQVATALHALAIFRTMDGHVQKLTETVPELKDQHESVRRVLDMIRDAGLLTSAETVCTRLKEKSTRREQAPTRVFIMTCDRPRALERLLQSMIMAGNLGRHEELFIVDDSRDPANVELNRDLVRQFNLTSPVDMRYVGRQEQSQLVRGISAQVPGSETHLDFLVGSERWAGYKTYGRTRTLCLLLSVGRRAIVLDDDIVCAAVATPHRADGVGFRSNRLSDFYESEQDMLSRTRREDFDPLSGHATCLGLDLGHALDELGAHDFRPAGLKGANSLYLSQWDADSPVLLTQAGTVGDPGSPSSNWIYMLDRESAQRLLSSPMGLDGAMRSHHFWRGQPRPTFSKMAYISQMTGLDNASYLPPYFPVFRGEDSLFGAMVEHLHPRAAVLEYDWAVPHLPLDVAERREETPPHSGRGYFSMEKYLTDRTLYEENVGFDTRHKRLVLLLRELSEHSDDGLLTLFRTEVAEYQRTQEEVFTRLLQDGIARPERWSNYLQQGLANLRDAMGQPAKLQEIAAIPDDASDRLILDTFRQYTGEFAAALEAWAGIREASVGVTAQLLAEGALRP
jgi:hypothetical protein